MRVEPKYIIKNLCTYYIGLKLESVLYNILELF